MLRRVATTGPTWSNHAVQPVAGVAEPGNDVAELVEALVEACRDDGDRGVRAEGRLDRADPLGRGEQADGGDVVRAAVEDEGHRRGERAARREHRVEQEDLAT